MQFMWVDFDFVLSGSFLFLPYIKILKSPRRQQQERVVTRAKITYRFLLGIYRFVCFALATKSLPSPTSRTMNSPLVGNFRSVSKYFQELVHPIAIFLQDLNNTTNGNLPFKTPSLPGCKPSPKLTSKQHNTIRIIAQYLRDLGLKWVCLLVFSVSSVILLLLIIVYRLLWKLCTSSSNEVA